VDEYLDEYVTDPGYKIPVAMDHLGRIARPVQIQNTNASILTEQEEARFRDAVEAVFNVPFFHMQSMQDKNMTRAEFLGRQAQDSQKILPMVGRVISEELDPLLEAVGDYAEEFGLLPEMPEVLKKTGKDSKLIISYVNPLTALQKRATGLAGTQSFIQDVSGLNQLVSTAPPEVQDAFKAQDIVDIIADANGMTRVLTDKSYREESADNRKKAAIAQAQAAAQAQAMAATQGAPQ
jgi:hypothetical protein